MRHIYYDAPFILVLLSILFNCFKSFSPKLISNIYIDVFSVKGFKMLAFYDLFKPVTKKILKNMYFSYHLIIEALKWYIFSEKNEKRKKSFSNPLPDISRKSFDSHGSCHKVYKFQCFRKSAFLAFLTQFIWTWRNKITNLRFSWRNLINPLVLKKAFGNFYPKQFNCISTNYNNLLEFRVFLVNFFYFRYRPGLKYVFRTILYILIAQYKYR